MPWSFSKNNGDAKYRSIREFIIGLCRINRKALVDSFTYCKKLERNLKDHKANTKEIFIEYNDDDNVCTICLAKLIGPCVKYDCECGLIMHESCLFRLILGGHIKCPQCSAIISNKPYNPIIKYPITINTLTVEDEINKILSRSSNADQSLKTIEKTYINDISSLQKIYNIA